MRKNRRRAACTALVAVSLGVLGLAPSAQAKLTGAFTRFAQCPYTTAGVSKCIHAVTNKGEVTLGSKKVPIVNPVTLQGGYGLPDEAGFSAFFGAKNGVTLAKVGQPVPGGLAGIVPDEKSPFLVKLLIKFFFENSLTGVNSVLELAKPASEIRVSENNIGGEEGVGMKLPVMVRLENPFLGKNCRVGSTTTPIKWELTTGKTSPPAPNTSIDGQVGFVEFLEEGSVLEAKENIIVDNAWSAPAASGCGGILSFLVNPIINGQLGSTAAGRNTAILNNTLSIGAALAVKFNDEENP